MATLVKGVDAIVNFAAETHVDRSISILLRLLKETIERYNRSVKENFDKEFLKPILPGAHPLTLPPY